MIDELKVVIFGERVEKDMNMCNLVEIQQQSDFGSQMDEREEDGEAEENEEEADEVKSRKTTSITKVEKKNNIPLISDYFVKDIDFALRLLSGENYESNYLSKNFTY